MGRRVAAYLVAALIILLALLTFVAWLPVREARAQWRAGRYADALETADEWSRWRLWPRQWHQLRAASHLAAGRRANADPHLRALGGATLWVSALDASEVAKRLFARGAYAEFVAYDDAAREPSESPNDRARARVALQRIAAAERAGRYAFAFDRRGAPLAEYVLAERRVVAASDAFGGVAELLKLHRPSANERIETTIDGDVQRLALESLGKYRGSLVAIDPSTNEILAMAGTSPNESFEPGSVVKVLTLLAALEGGVNVGSLFPYECNGALEIDGRSFGDWRTHGTLPDVEEALAQSCNTLFADLGLRAGRDRLRAIHRRAGFDGPTNLGIFRVHLGRTAGNIYNNFETGFYAIGLEHESVTTFHLAMLASMLANRGALTTPRFVRAHRTIIGDALGAPPKQSAVQIAPRASVEKVIAAMQAVVTREQGTGRRARIEGVPLALKTGTSGTRAHGYDTVIFGFAPVEQPKIAFAVYAPNAGSAEIAGAEIVKAFLERMKARGHL